MPTETQRHRSSTVLSAPRLTICAQRGHPCYRVDPYRSRSSPPIQLRRAAGGMRAHVRSRSTNLPTLPSTGRRIVTRAREAVRAGFTSRSSQATNRLSSRGGAASASEATATCQRRTQTPPGRAPIMSPHRSRQTGPKDFWFNGPRRCGRGT